MRFITSPTYAEVDADLLLKQDTLVSGTNIKTINSTNILGSGDIVISGGGSMGVNQTMTANTVYQAGSKGGFVLVKNLNGYQIQTPNFVIGATSTPTTIMWDGGGSSSFAPVSISIPANYYWKFTHSGNLDKLYYFPL